MPNSETARERERAKVTNKKTEKADTDRKSETDRKRQSRHRDRQRQKDKKS